MFDMPNRRMQCYISCQISRGTELLIKEHEQMRISCFLILAVGLIFLATPGLVPPTRPRSRYARLGHGRARIDEADRRGL